MASRVILVIVGSAALVGMISPRQSKHACEASERSRWSVGSDQYRRTSVFGNGEPYLEALTGIAADGKDVLVFDAAAAKVHVLDHSLRTRRSFGRKGQGPGEFAVPLIVHLSHLREFRANYVALSDSITYVFDGAYVHSFTRHGDYKDRVASAARGATTFSIFALRGTESGLLYAYDSADISGTRTRSLQTWRAQHGAADLVYEHPLRTLPGPRGRYSSWSRDPMPLWAATETCVYWSDGESERLYRLNMVTQSVDTIPLPQHRIPPDDYDAEMHKRLAERVGAPPPAPRPRNAPLVRWSAMIVDPDGHVWIKPWYAGHRLDGPALRIDPAGRVHRERLPVFPIAFGPPRVYYAREIDRETDEVLVVRYDLQNQR